MDQLRALRYFAKVAETGSFTLAADSFAVPPSSISRRIADLEEFLGASLLSRSTRAVKLTEVGQSYLSQVQDALEILALGEESVRCYQTQPMGHLRISVMSGFGDRVVLPLLHRFSQLYPDIVLDISLSDEIVTLGRDDVDLAIRGGYAPNERVQAIRLMDNEFIPVAAPTYLRQAGTPQGVLELREHQGLFYRTPRGPTPWLCRIDGQWHDVSGKPAAISNSGRWLGELATQGRGILMAPRWSLLEHLAEKRLVELSFSSRLYVHENPDLAIFLLYQRQRYHVPKVRIAVDFLVQHLRKEDRAEESITS